MKKNEQNSRIMVGALLKRTRLENGAIQREIAIELGLPNPNYLSMIESGRNAVPIKRLTDIGAAYRLRRLEALAIVKLTAPELWQVVCCCNLQVGMSQELWKDLDAKVDGVIESTTACDQVVEIQN